MLVGITGFEPATSSSRTKRATKLRHIPVVSRTVVRGTRNTIPLGSGLAKTAGWVRFVVGVLRRGGGCSVAVCCGAAVAAVWRWLQCGGGGSVVARVGVAVRFGLDPPLQKTISSFVASFLRKPRSRSGKIGKRRYRLLGSSRDLRRSRRAGERAGRPATTPQPTAPQQVYPRSTTRISDADGGQNRRTGAYLDWPSPLDTSIHMRP